MRALAFVCLVVLFAGCGGGNSTRMLHLSSGDVTEDQLRLNIRATLTQPASETLCRSLKGLSDKDAAAVVVAAQAGSQTPVQQASEADRTRAAAILKDECSRVY